MPTLWWNERSTRFAPLWCRSTVNVCGRKERLAQKDDELSKPDRIPDNCGIVFRNKHQRISVVLMSLSFQFQQHCVGAWAHLTWCRWDHLLFACTQIQVANWRFAFIFRVFPVAEQHIIAAIAMQTAPTAMPCTEARYNVEHCQESSMIDVHREFVVNFHVNTAKQWAPIARHQIQREIGALCLTQWKCCETVT